MSSSSDARWYVLRVMAGREKTVLHQINLLRAKPNLADVIGEVVLPTQSVIKIKRGKKTTQDKMIFSGYLIVKLVISRDIMNLMCAINGVSGFLTNNGFPVSLRDEEVEKMISRLEEKMKILEDEILFDIGQKVKIKEGPFEAFVGEVESVDYEKKRLRLAVTIFGRPTPVELEWHQVDVISDDTVD